MAGKKSSVDEKMTTREKIIWESLRLFCKNGYEGVSIREIAATVGIKGASIYNHFKSKEAIFHAIFEEMTKQYSRIANDIHLPQVINETSIQDFANMEEEQLQQMADGLLQFYTQNEFVVMFRRMIVSEQFRTSIAAKYYKEYYLEAPFLFQKQIFEGIQKCGGFNNYDADIMALHFYSPIYYILSRYDAGSSLDECKILIKKHIHTFVQLYSAD